MLVGRITGMVVTAASEALGDVKVRIDGTLLGAIDRQTTTREGGRFELDVAHRALFNLVFEKQGYLTSRRIRVAAGSELLVVLTPGEIIKGQVADSKTSQPIPDAEIQFGAAADLVTTDADGWFSTTSQLPSVSVRVYKPGYHTWQEPVVRADAKHLLVELDALPNQPHVLRLRDAHSGDPVLGATVQPGEWSPSDQGVYAGTISEWRQGRFIPLRVHSIGYGSIEVSVVPDGNHAASEISLTRTSEVRVKVVEQDGAPIGGALLTLTAEQDPKRSWNPFPSTRERTTDSDGFGTYSTVHRDLTYELNVRTPGGGEAARTFVIDLDRHSVTLDPEIVIEAPRGQPFRVFDLTSGEPIESAALTVPDGDGIATTDVDGLAQWWSEDAGASVRIDAEGYASVEVQLPSSENRVPVVEVGLHRDLRVSGRVVASNGDAVAEAIVTAQRAHQPGGDTLVGQGQLARVIRCSSGLDGLFELKGLAVGYYEIAAQRAGEPAGEAVTILAGATHCEITAMGPSGVIARVLNEKGAPAHQAQVGVFTPDGRYVAGASTTGARNSIFIDVDPGTWTVVAAAPGLTSVVTPAVAIAPEQVVERTIHLNVEGVLEGTVHDSSTSPMQGTLEALVGSQVVSRATVGADGTFRLPGLGGEEVGLRLRRYVDMGPVEVEDYLKVTPSYASVGHGELKQLELEVDRTGGGAFKGELRIDAGIRNQLIVRGAVLSFEPFSNGADPSCWVNVRLDGEERFELPWLRHGRYRVSAELRTGERRRLRTHTVRVTPKNLDVTRSTTSLVTFSIVALE